MSIMTNTNLYQVLYRGDSRIASAHPSAILLVGLTRAGKSTTFNWILNKVMRGENEEDDDIITHYVNVVEGSDSAEVGNTFTSVTLCPNVVELDRTNCISLIDMAGYKDKRDYIGVLGVSYFLKAVFEKVRRAKFLIVLGEDKLMENSGDGIIDTFSEFIRMFNVHLMDAPTKQAFYNSVSIVVTRSKQETRHHGCLKRINKMLKDPRLNVERKQEIVSLVDYLINKNRIQPFKVALLNQQPQRCTFVERFDRMGWEFFDIQRSEQALGQELISLPYSKDYETLGQDQRSKFDLDITHRVQSYIQFSKILKTFIGSVQRNWHNCITQWETDSEFSLNLASYSEVFEQIRKFLQNSDFYHSENFITAGFRAEYRSLSLVQTIRKVLQIYKIAESIGRQANDFINNMVAYTLLFSELIDCLLAFASSSETEHLLLRLKFIIRQGFREFSKLYQINRDIIHDVSQKMKDNVNEIFDCPQHQFIEKFVRKIDAQLMRRLFTNVDDLMDYESLFNDYELAFKHMFTQTIFFSRHNSDIQVYKAALLRPNGRKRQVLQCEINAFRAICLIAEETSRSYEPEQVKDLQLKTLYIKKLATIKAIISLLRELKEVPKAKVHALNLSIHIRNIHAACEIYQMIIEDATDQTTKMQKIGDYADYCLEWGRFQKATTLLQQKLELEGQSFQNFQSTIKKMQDVAKNQSIHLKKYQTNLASICSSAKVQEEDSVLIGFLEEIQASINEP